VVAAESEVRVLVYRDGPMARLGHNHVLRTQALQGDIDIGDKGQDPRISLVVPVASFSVDDTKLRAEEGGDFPGVVEDNAIAGTRKNLLSEALLDGARYLEIRLTSRKVTGIAPDYTMTVAVEEKGETHELTVPVRVEHRPNELRATGAFTATHAQLGLTPFTVMGGLLSVRDEIKLRFKIVARPWHTDPP
jgi:polyisoprenoid-binding protein YceI